MRALSRAAYLEALYQGLMAEIVDAARDGELHRPLDLTFDYRPDDTAGYYSINLFARFVPDDSVSHSATCIVERI